MTEPPRPVADRIILVEADQVRLAPGVALKQDRVRDQWQLLAPERVLLLDDISLAIVQLVRQSGMSIGTAIDRLAEDFNAPRQEIASDVIALLIDMLAKGFLVKASP